MIRAFTACLLVGVTVGCASAPVQPAVAFETKMSWILRLEDRREIRDVSVPVAPPEAAGGRARGLQVASPSPDLFALLADPEARVRRRAALAAGRVGLPEAAPHLVTLLQRDVDPEVRQMAAFALGLLGDQSQVEPLRQALEDPSPVVAGRAAEALGLLGDSASAPAIGRLVAAHVDAASTVGHDDGRAPNASADAFRLGVYALTRLKAYEPLAAATLAADGRPKTQWWPLAYALGRIEDQRALPALLSLAASDGTYTRSFASKGLGALKDPSAVPVLLPLVDAANPAGAVEAMRALARIGDPRAEEPIVGIIRNPRVGPMLRAEALLAAADVGIDTTQDFIVDFLADSAPAVRAAALRAVSKGDADTFMAILSGLDPDPHWSVRADLASLLAEREPERALPRLTEMLRDPDVRVIPRVLDALAKLKAPGLTTILLEHLDREDAVVRTYAAGGLGEIRPPEAVEPLVAAFKRGESDASYSARAAALGALAKYGAAAAVPSLRVALSDRDWAVRVRAAELLKELDPSAETIQAIRPAPVGASTRYDLPSLVNPTVSPHVYFETDKGTIEIELDVLNAPLTSENFIALVGKGFFEGLPVHRLVPDFVAQAGDPRGDGEGGPGYTIRDELNEEPYLRGTMGMALNWQDTGGSQFFIAYSPQPHLDARYTVFGRVVAGMDVVDRLAQWDVMRRVRVWDGQTVSGR